MSGIIIELLKPYLFFTNHPVICFLIMLFVFSSTIYKFLFNLYTSFCSIHQNLKNYLTNNNYSGITDENTKRQLRRIAKKYTVVSDKLYFNLGESQPLVIKECELPNILSEIHSSHQCAEYTYALAKGRYYWPSYVKTIRDYVKNCEECQRNAQSLKRPNEALQPMPIIARAWYRVGMDLTGPLIPSQGYQYILTMVDHFTKWVETRPLKSKTTSEVSRGIFSIYCTKGAPVQIISDNGGEFRSQLMEYLHEEYNCRLIFTAPYSPQTNGLTESYHTVIKTCLIKSLSGQQGRWVENLEHITFSLNIRPRNQSTGYSAFELMHS